MTQTLRQIQTEFKQAIAAQTAVSNTPAVVELRSRFGLVLSQHERWALAARQFNLAAQLALDAKQTAVAAQLRYAEGNALQQLPQRHKDAIHTLREAQTLYKQAGNATGNRKSHEVLAQIHVERREFDAALSETAAIKTKTPAEQIHNLRQQAAIHYLAGDTSKATVVLQQALDMALAEKNERMQLEIEVELQEINSQQSTINNQQSTKSDPIQDLLMRCQQAKLFGMVANLELEQAMAALTAQDWETAVSHAQAARQSAMQSSEMMRYLTYLNACLLLTLSYEQLNKDAAVIDTLLTCKNSLQRHLGEPYAQLMREILDSLLPRWGKARFQTALAAYRQGIDN
ncbi:MAG: hypothetical protein GY943_11085 [Chloroflexi bacterium]|nr:hypothetical protein [Chloroflexota bacterium]